MERLYQIFKPVCGTDVPFTLSGCDWKSFVCVDFIWCGLWSSYNLERVYDGIFTDSHGHGKSKYCAIQLIKTAPGLQNTD